MSFTPTTFSHTNFKNYTAKLFCQHNNAYAVGFPENQSGITPSSQPASNTAVLQKFVAQAWSYLIATSAKEQTISEETNSAVDKTTEYMAYQCWQLVRLELLPSLHLTTSTVGNFLLSIPLLSEAVLFN